MEKKNKSEQGKFPIIPKLLSTSFGFGFLPVAPGTWGAIFAVITWMPLFLFASRPVLFWVTLAMIVVYTIAGTWASGVAEKYWGKDPVIACADETVGQWISMLPMCWLKPDFWWIFVIALALFRFFDIYKPLGIRSMEKLPGGIGMMADDILAAIYSAILLWIFDITVLPAWAYE